MIRGLFGRLLAVMCGVAAASTGLAALLQERSLSADLERAAEHRLDTAAAAAEHLLQRHLGAMAERYRAVSGTPQFRATLEVNDAPTLAHYARTLLAQHGAARIVFEGRDGGAVAAAGEPGLDVPALAVEGVGVVAHEGRPYAVVGIPLAEVGRLVPEFYGIPLDREVIVVVLDFSGSVRGPGGDLVLQRLGKSLSLLPSTRRFTVLAFDERMLHLADEPLPALPDLKISLLEFLKDLPPGQRTELLTPIRTGVAFAAEYGGDGAQVLVISDGAPTKAGPPLDDLLDRLGEIPRGRVRIDVAVHGGREVSLFRFLSRSTSGMYVALPAAK